MYSAAALLPHHIAGGILGMGSANKKRRYIVMSSLIGRDHKQNDPIQGVYFKIDLNTPCDTIVDFNFDKKKHQGLTCAVFHRQEVYKLYTECYDTLTMAP